MFCCFKEKLVSESVGRADVKEKAASLQEERKEEEEELTLGFLLQFSSKSFFALSKKSWTENEKKGNIKLTRFGFFHFSSNSSLAVSRNSLTIYFPNESVKGRKRWMKKKRLFYTHINNVSILNSTDE